MPDEPIQITVENAQALAAIAEINSALLNIGQSAAIGGGGIDTFASRSAISLNALGVQIDEIKTKFASLGELSTVQSSMVRQSGQLAPLTSEQRPALASLAQTGPTGASTYKELRDEVTLTKAALDGSEASIARYTNAQAKLNTFMQETDRTARNMRQSIASGAAPQTRQYEPAVSSLSAEQQEQIRISNEKIAAERAAAKAAAETSGAAAPMGGGLEDVAKGADTAAESVKGLANATQMARNIFVSTGNDVAATGKALQDYGYSAAEVKGIMAEAGITGGGDTGVKNLGNLRKALNDARNEFDGSPQSVERLVSAYKAYNDMLMRSKGYTGELTQGQINLGNTFERQMLRIGIGILIWSTLRTAQQELNKTVQAMEQYSIAVARFAGVTDQSIGEANAQYKALQATVAQQGFTPTQAAPGIISAARYEKNPVAQQELVSTAAKVSEAMGLKDTTQATEALAAANKATGLSYQELGDAAAFAYSKAGGDSADMLKALTTAQNLADEFGIKWQQAFMLLVKSSEASREPVGTVAQTLARFSGVVDSLSGDKLTSFVAGFRAMGIDVLDTNKSLKSTGDILSSLGAAKLSPQQMTDALELLGGEKLREQARQAGLGIMQALTGGVLEGSTDFKGALDTQVNLIDQTLGQMVARVKARADEMRTQFNLLGAMVADIQSGNVAVLLGNIQGEFNKGLQQAGLPLPKGAAIGAEAGGRQALEYADISTSIVTQGQQKTKDTALKSLVGLTPNEVKTAVDEYNTVIEGIGHAQTIDLSGMLISQSELDAKMQDAGKAAGSKLGVGVVAGFKSVDFGAIGNLVHTAITNAKAAGVGAAVQQQQVPTSRTQQQGLSAQEAYLANLRTTMGKSDATDKQVSDALQMGNMLDLTKYSYAEINQAKMLSAQMEAQDIALLREKLTLLGLSAAEIDRAVTATIAEGNATQQVVRTRSEALIMGQRDAKYFQDALQQIDQKMKAQKSESDFVFQRHKDISPEQFPQLQSLTAMYDAMLTKLGSPEKEKNINLLLGDNNTFKTMTARLSALQMAMEDLTKVEKAQLSGTWNLPSGATALVPINSLDLQRWNGQGQGGGGMSPDALMALLTQMGLAAKQQAATGAGGGAGGGWYGGGYNEMTAGKTPPRSMEATYDIVELVRTARSQAQQRQPAVAAPQTAPQATRDDYDKIEAARAARGQQPLNGIQQIATVITSLNQVASNLARAQIIGGGGRMAASGGAVSDVGSAIDRTLKQSPPKVDVNVSLLPLRVALTANMSVMLDGRVVARAIYPILYQMLTRASKGMGQNQTSLGGIR